MALRNIDRSKDLMNCPRCGGEAVIIDGKIVRWLTCTKCKFKTVIEQQEKEIKVTPLRTEEEMKALTKI